MTVHDSVLDLIGNTPIVDVSALSPNPNVRILGKMEGQNPAGSVKDLIALSMINEAEHDGTLSPGKTIIEPSSGNTGIAMAMICQIRGYHLKIVLPGNVSAMLAGSDRMPAPLFFGVALSGIVARLVAVRLLAGAFERPLLGVLDWISDRQILLTVASAAIVIAWAAWSSRRDVGPEESPDDIVADFTAHGDDPAPPVVP